MLYKYPLLILLICFFSTCKKEEEEIKTNKLAYKQIKMKHLFGINAFEWDFLERPNGFNDGNTIYEPKMNLLKSFSAVRHYMDWDKIEETENVYSFDPTTNGGWNYDRVYQRSKMEGIFILACLQNVPAWISKTYPKGQQDRDVVPLKYGANREDPKSYKEMSRAIFQYAARYGSNKNIDTNLITLFTKPRWTNDRVNKIRVGLDLVKYVECNNEPDKWWKGQKAQQTGSEYAANLSAFYDGHKGTMGKDAGVKTADPKMKVVIGGIARADSKYIREIIEWCKKNRGYKADGTIDLCFDVINFHMYSNDNTSWFDKFKTSTTGVAPEINKNMGRIADDLVALGAEVDKSIEVWTTETGYDLNEGSVQSAKPIGSKSILLTQADWILRTSLMYARHGISRVFFYQAYDSNSPGNDAETPFATSGLLNDDSRRPAADYILQTTKLMGEYIYSNTINSDPIVDIYTAGGKTMYVLVVPDQIDRKEKFELKLKNATKARIYNLKPGADKMDFQDFPVSNGKIEVEVTETPIFVQAL